LHHQLASWVNTDALHGLGDAADSRKSTFMVRVQNQPVNPVVLVATFGGKPAGATFEGLFAGFLQWVCGGQIKGRANASWNGLSIHF
jgi:hypothetical protein